MFIFSGTKITILIYLKRVFDSLIPLILLNVSLTHVRKKSPSQEKTLVPGKTIKGLE